MSFKLVFCLLLASAALPVAARDAAMLSPNGGGDCPIVQEDDLETGDGRTADKRAGAAAATGKAKTATRRGGDADSAARPPRWHSFLPGMFR